MSAPPPCKTDALNGLLSDGRDVAQQRNLRQLLWLPHQVIILSRNGETLKKLRRMLTREGFSVAVFRAVNDLLQHDRPDSICCLLLENDQDRGISGLDVLANLRTQGWSIPTIYLSSSWNTRSVVQAMHHGADNFLIMPIEPPAVLDAVHRALRRSYHKVSQAKASTMLDSLAEIERQVVEMAASGLLNKEIADQLNVAHVTVKVYRARAMRKLRVDSAASLGRFLALAEIDQAMWFDCHNGHGPNEMHSPPNPM